MIRYVYPALILCVIFLSLLSGPYISEIDLTDDPVHEGIAGTGNVTVDSVQVPMSEVTLTPAKYGSGAYHLNIPDATVNISSLSGYPVINFKVRVEQTGSVHITTTAPEDRGQLRISFQQVSYPPDKLTSDTLTVELRIILRDDGGFRTVFEDSVALTVN